MSNTGFLASDYVQLFFDLFEHSSDSVSLARLDDGVLLEVNNSFLSLYQRTRREVIGQSAVALGLWVRPEERASLVAELKAKGRVLGHRARMRSTYSEEFTISLSVILTHLRGEEVILGIGTVVQPARGGWSPEPTDALFSR